MAQIFLISSRLKGTDLRDQPFDWNPIEAFTDEIEACEYVKHGNESLPLYEFKARRIDLDELYWRAKFEFSPERITCPN